MATIKGTAAILFGQLAGQKVEVLRCSNATNHMYEVKLGKNEIKADTKQRLEDVIKGEKWTKQNHHEDGGMVFYVRGDELNAMNKPHPEDVVTPGDNPAPPTPGGDDGPNPDADTSTGEPVDTDQLFQDADTDNNGAIDQDEWDRLNDRVTFNARDAVSGRRLADAGPTAHTCLSPPGL